MPGRSRRSYLHFVLIRSGQYAAVRMPGLVDLAALMCRIVLSLTLLNGGIHYIGSSRARAYIRIAIALPISAEWSHVIRRSLRKPLVNRLQVVKRISTPLNFLNNWRRRQTMVFWVVGAIPTIHNKKLFRFSHVELEKYSPRYTRYPGNETAWILTSPPVYRQYRRYIQVPPAEYTDAHLRT